MSEFKHSSVVTSPQSAAAASLLVLNQGPVLNSRENPGTSIQNSLFSGYSFNIKEDLADSKLDNPRVELYSMAEENGVGSGVVSITYPDGAEQTSPITPVPQTQSQILPYRPSGSSGDAMLSAINYNENEILQDGAFDVSVTASLPNLDDGLLSNMGTHDLFDGEGNVNDSYDMEGLSPHSFNDPGSGLVDGSLSSVIDSDSLGSLDQSRTPDSSKQKKKNKTPKLSPGSGTVQGSPGKSNMLMCPTCSKSFNNSSALAKHRLTHSDERKYVCNLCQKAFKRQDHLNGHLMTHRDKKPYECTVENCQKSYCDARSLRRHLENHHNQTPEQIQSAIAKVSTNAAAVIAAAAASNTASIKATTPGTGSQATTNIATVPPMLSDSMPNQENSNTNTQFSENSTPMASPNFPVPSQHQPFFQYDQGGQPPMILQQVAANQQQSQPVSQSREATIQLPQQLLGANLGVDESSERQPQTITIHSLSQQQVWQEIKNLTQPGQQATGNSHTPQSPNEEQSPGYSPISPVPNSNIGLNLGHNAGQGHARLFTSPGAAGTNVPEKPSDDKTSLCTICDRTFKNVQALNGHMRLHGGYFKKETKEEKKTKKVTTIRDMVPPMSVVHQAALTTSLPQPFPTTATDQVQSSQQARINDGYGQSNPLMSPIAVESSQNEPSPQVTHPLPTLSSHTLGSQYWDQIQLQQAQQEQQMQHQIQQMQLQLEKEQQIREQQQQTHLQQQQEQQIQSHIQQQLQQLQLEHQQQIEAQRQAQQRQQAAQIKQEQSHAPITQDQVKQELQYIQQHHQGNNQPGSLPPSPQVSQPPHLQRQGSVESASYDFQHHLPQQQFHPAMQTEINQDHNHPQFTGLPASMAIQLQQLAQRQEQQRQEQQLGKKQGQEKTLAQRQEPLVQRTEHGQLPRFEHSVPRPEPQMIQRQDQLQPNNSGQLPGDLNLQLSSVQLLQSPPNVTLNSFPHLQSPPSVGSIQSNLQNPITQAQLSTFALQTPQKNDGSGLAIQRLLDPSALSASQVTLVSTSQEMTVSQILNSLESSESFAALQNLLPVTTPANTNDSANFGNKVNIDLKEQRVNTGNLFPAVTSCDSNDVLPQVGGIGKSQDFDLDKTLDDISDIYKKELVSAATKDNPFSFPSIGAEMTDQSSGRNISEGKELNSMTIQNRHKELKRRLSLGNEIQTAPPINISAFSTHKSGASSHSKHVLSNSAFSESRHRMRSKSGDDFKFFRSKSEEDSFMRPRSRTVVSPMKSKSHERFTWERSTSYLLSKSDGAQHGFGQFRNPNMLTGQLKMRRKHRPAPLFIPPHKGSGGFQSHLRSPRIAHGTEGRGHTPPPYTPPPMLSPIRSGSGLFCSLSSAWKPPMTPKSAPITPRSLLLSSRSSSLKDDVEESSGQPVLGEEPPPETDVLPHVNIGSQYQAEIPPYNSSTCEAFLTESKEDLLWDPSTIVDILDDDVQYYQDLACSAAVNGNGFNVEYALHILHMFKGDVQMAMLKLMEGKMALPSNHTLLTYTYQETDSWSTEEIERYQQALWKCDKDFFALSKEMGTKSTKECVQFYYLWKKVCPDEHKRLRLIRRRREQERLYNLRSSQQQQTTTQPSSQPPNSNVADQTAPSSEQVTNYEEYEEMESESGASTEVEEQNEMETEEKSSEDKMSNASSVCASPTPSWQCNYPDCNATFNSKQGLNGHVRIHKGASGNKGTTPARVLPSGETTGPSRPVKPTSHANRSPMYDDLGNEIFPCRLCGRVFGKVKSRSAHMKSHRVIDNDKNKNKTANTSTQNNYEMSVNKFQGSPYR